MSEDSELQAKIAALSGRINLHKQREQGSHYQQQPHYGSDSEQRHNDNPDRITDTRQGHGRGSANWAPYRGTPYGAHRGRGGKIFNRTLVLNNNNVRLNGTLSGAGTAQANGLSDGKSDATPQTSEGSGWVVKRDRHMQLFNPAIYDQVAQQRTKAIEQTAEQRRQQRSMKEKARLSKHFQGVQKRPGHAAVGVQTTPANQQAYEIDIDNIRFLVADGGSKLIRVSDDPNKARATPKQTKIGGVTFLRSKNGNLYRAGLVKTKQNSPVKKTNEPCPRFSTTGWPFPSRSMDTNGASRLVIRFVCPGFALTWNTRNLLERPQCRYLHDPNKVAICKDHLLRGSCPLGDGCDLSHEPTANRVPAVNPSAPVCRAFATLGYCEKGADCAERHVFECPDYANHAVCRNKKCRLPHVDRAGQIRKAAAAQTAASDELGSPDLSSDEEYDEIDSDDVDSDEEIEDVFMQGSDDHGHELSRQQDFVGF